ncbi:GFA family protein [Agitococcus lubricus]|uniref:CENP-V/GFA domain-containing protein n=1 Tax=Agitococcus lubricus TaxID=1077255 RepID=A0A2T5IZX6_9GAMM|nr:GFA family protein [Agitococcus lubricus]PTQ89602.1 hypothetical protein C8N29_106133 [Agitococcus lubricus]
MTSQYHTGACLCGAVRFETLGEPVAAYVCHCQYCKRASGSSMQIAVFFKPTQVQISGELSHYDYISPIHGRTIQSQFCPRCGTKIASRISRVPKVILISGGAFDDPNWFTISCHLFTQHKLTWMPLPSDTPCYLEHFLTEAGEAVAPLKPVAT